MEAQAFVMLPGFIVRLLHWHAVAIRAYGRSLGRRWCRHGNRRQSKRDNKNQGNQVAEHATCLAA
jgi:hypothetical protein